MKRFSLSIFLVLVILVIIGGYLFVNSDMNNIEDEIIENNKQNVEVEETDLSEFDLDDNFEIIEIRSDNVLTDTSKDKIILVGKNPQESNIYWDEMMIILKNENDDLLLKKQLKDFAGYEPEIKIKDITGNNVKDIFLKAASGGSGGIYFHRVLTLKENDLKVIFDEDNNEGINVVGYFADGFKANLMFKNLNKRATLDISANQNEYIDQNIYNKDGEMIQIDLVRPHSYPFSNLEVIDYNQDGKYDLRGIQRIIGAYGADTISEVESVWSYEDEGWNILEVNYTTYLKK
mgnify:CR=1 FL=1